VCISFINIQGAKDFGGRREMSLRCENCGAPYKGSISPYQKFVKCQHCGGTLKVNPDESTREKRVLVREAIVEPRKAFKMDEFAAFLIRRGVKTFDPLSGVLKLGSHQVYVSEEGAVEGSEPLKSRVEKWIHIFMSDS